MSGAIQFPLRKNKIPLMVVVSGMVAFLDASSLVSGLIALPLNERWWTSYFII
jgi:hypothetical protein